ncbi:ABC transporter ATP-binding protein [Micromonospora carbonacea]|uniref:Oligopeptide/dipeptide ABC transporter, ATP-binding protein, C-terminal domain-containing protein n=1 Tax=Micromonospora carbonacea TaxID=47853 RepID=A0A1C4V8L0_9ACTN|nr:ABC transporter ATP-binding protein [Micromonospora carbonacea]SCE80236.1 oligopeptide/dipeptide ABC transporter, ATP-binding protein, C-terminal domain-containing protein [Micromonospora carbonacea]
MTEQLAVSPGMPMDDGGEAVLDVEKLSILHGQNGQGAVPIVSDVSFRLRQGETLGLVGESGSGKSLTALGLIGLLPMGLRGTGRIDLLGRDLVGLSERQLESVRGAQISMVFQDPMTGLNPVRTVGSTLAEAARRHRRCSRAEARELVIDGLAAVGIPSPRERFSAYPHQLSGGLRQRVMIALALINSPSVILADEPTTALDTTVQAQIMRLLQEKTRQAALVLITHDLGVAAELSDRIAVMYSGRIVEQAPVAGLLTAPRHPYTMALLAAAPTFDRSRRLVSIPGLPPSPFDRPTGCPFHPRCPRALPTCAVQRPPLTEHAGAHLACWNPHD